MPAHHPRGRRLLQPGFRPGPLDVLCARGKNAYDHEGTARFRDIVKDHAEIYAKCSGKYEKSKIVSKIVNAVREASPYGGFVRRINQKWYEVGDRAAKEKIGQTFRDLLHTKYSSSTKAKAKVRVQRRTMLREGQESESYASSSQPESACLSKVVSPNKATSQAKNTTKGSGLLGSDVSMHSSDMTSSVSVISDDDDADEKEAASKQKRTPRDAVLSSTSTAPSLITVRANRRPSPSLYDMLRESIQLCDPASDLEDLEPLPLDEDASQSPMIEFNDSEIASPKSSATSELDENLFDDDAKDFLGRWVDIL